MRRLNGEIKDFNRELERIDNIKNAVKRLRMRVERAEERIEKSGGDSRHRDGYHPSSDRHRR
jgi:hypothetical protein